MVATLSRLDCWWPSFTLSGPVRPRLEGKKPDAPAWPDHGRTTPTSRANNLKQIVLAFHNLQRHIQTCCRRTSFPKLRSRCSAGACKSSPYIEEDRLYKEFQAR